jgi:hypothetical protein
VTAPRRGDRGSLAPAVAAMIVILFLLGGLIVDGARALGARSRATAYAEEGARVVGQGVTFDNGNFEIDPAAVDENAEGYCARISANDPTVDGCTRELDGGEIVYTVRVTIEKGILGLVSPGPMTFEGTGRAIAEIGIYEATGGSDERVELSPRYIDGNEVMVNVKPGAEAGCVHGAVWTDAPATFSPRPFRYIRMIDHLSMGPWCPRPPICPNPDELISLEHGTREDEITDEMIRGDERWSPEFVRCPTASSLLYAVKPRPPGSESPSGSASPSGPASPSGTATPSTPAPPTPTTTPTDGDTP